METQLPVSDRAPARARAAVADALNGTLPVERVRDGQLLVSELVTNSIVHARLTSAESITMVVAVDDRRVRIAICDPGPGFEHRPKSFGRPLDLGETGRGLSLVDRLADRWGTVRAFGSKVWFEIDR